MLPEAVRASITGLVLAGGRAMRMGGADKGLLLVGGRAMIDRVLDGLAPQVGPLRVSANRNREQYADRGYPVLPDTREGFHGPLAGVLSACSALDTDFLLVVPCDAPFLAPDLTERLYRALAGHAADVAVAHDGVRRQPAFLLMRRGLDAGLADYLDSGGRSVEGWLDRQRVVEVDLSDRPECFVNVNDPSELGRVEARLRSNVRAH